MAEPIQETVMRSVHAAESLYHRLVVLVGESGSGKTAVLRDVASQLGISVININLEIAKRLLEMTAKQRMLQLPVLLDQIVDADKVTVVLDNLEILFDRELKQDPLRLLQRIARNRCVVASWNGSAKNGKLTYAESGHPEHRVYESTDILIVGMDGAGASSSAKKNKEAGQV